MEDYTDHTKWKDVELYTHEMRLSDYQEYSLEEVVEKLTRLMTAGQEAGLENCYLKFSSRMEPYEDYLGSPSVVVCGYRPLNEDEKKELERHKKIEALAEEKKITFFEATQLLNLMEKGVVP